MGIAGGIVFVAVGALLGLVSWEFRKDGWGWVVAYITVGLVCATVGVALIVG